MTPYYMNEFENLREIEVKAAAVLSKAAAGCPSRTCQRNGSEESSQDHRSRAWYQCTRPFSFPVCLLDCPDNSPAGPWVVWVFSSSMNPGVTQDESDFVPQLTSDQHLTVKGHVC